MSSPSDLEVEVKFLVADLTAVRDRLITLGATRHKPRIFERNLRLDTPDELLLQRDQLLRLRQDTQVRLTFKGPSIAQTGSEVKVREELEFSLDDFDTAVHLFQRLGFEPVQTYEKYRETFRLGDLEIVLDELPFGNFIELEGSEKDIKTTAVALDLDWSKRVLENYLALMELLKAHYSLPFRDLTFANFATTDHRISDILDMT